MGFSPKEFNSHQIKRFLRKLTERGKKKAVCNYPGKDGKTRSILYGNFCRGILDNYIQGVASTGH